MTPPKATQADPTGSAAATPPAVLTCPLETLRKRPDFLAANRGIRQATKGFVLQARKRTAEHIDPETIRIGFTCSKKLGNAVARNRAKRRLREVARLGLRDGGLAGWDYVLIGRVQTTATLPFSRLLADLKTALSRLHAENRQR